MLSLVRGETWRGFYKEMVTGPPGFEPGFEAPEASVMSKLYYGPGMDAKLRCARALKLQAIESDGRPWTLAGSNGNWPPGSLDFWIPVARREDLGDEAAHRLHEVRLRRTP